MRKKCGLDHFEPFWAILGHIWATLVHFGSFFAIFGPFCGIFGHICGKFNFFCGSIGVAGLAFRMYGDGGVGVDQADQADPSSKPIRETLKYSGTTRPHTAFSRPQPIKTKKMRCHWLGATHHPNALLCLEMPCQGLFEIRRIDFAKSGEI